VTLRLYTGPLSMFGMKAEIALAEKGIAFDRIEVPFDNARGYEPKHPNVARINPKRQVPVLVHGDVEIFDSTQIFEYLEDAFPMPALWPSTPAGRAHARQIEHISDEVYFPPVIGLFALQDKLDTPEARKAIEAISREAERMEQRLGTKTYLSGSYTYADIAFFMAGVFAERMGAVLTSPSLMAWRMRVGTRPAVRPVVARLVRYLRDTHRSVPNYLQDIANSGKDST
jgi:glutathione S-transferase